MTSYIEEQVKKLIKIIEKLQWVDYDGCQGFGFMGSGPSMHHHPVCSICRGFEPKFNAQYDRCFNQDMITVGHTKRCKLGKALKEYYEDRQ